METYAFRIREMCEKGLNWRLYDRRFRWERNQKEPKTPWGERDNVIYDDIQDERIDRLFRSQSTKQQDTPSQSKVKKGSIPPSFCYAYHNQGRYCQLKRDCPYKHDCPQCGKGVHPAYLCGTQNTNTNPKDNTGSRDKNTNGQREYGQQNANSDSRR